MHGLVAIPIYIARQNYVYIPPRVLAVRLILAEHLIVKAQTETVYTEYGSRCSSVTSNSEVLSVVVRFPS